MYMEGIMKKLNSEEMRSVIVAVLLMVVGILFCCSLSIGIEGLSIIMGLILMIVGLLILFNLFMGDGKLYSINGIIGVGVLALGLMFLSHNLAGIIFAYIPWLLIVFGVVVIADGLLDKFVKKDSRLLPFILKMILGVLAIVLGVCLILIDGFLEYSSIIIGVLLIAYAGYILYLSLIKKQNIEV